MPVVRKQFGQSGDGVRRDAREHVVEPGKQLDSAPFAGSDPLTFAVVPLILLTVPLAAAWIPALRASRLDPLVASVTNRRRRDERG